MNFWRQSKNFFPPKKFFALTFDVPEIQGWLCLKHCGTGHILDPYVSGSNLAECIVSVTDTLRQMPRYPKVVSLITVKPFFFSSPLFSIKPFVHFKANFDSENAQV